MQLYTDGAHSSSTDCGGWAVVNSNKALVAQGSEKHTTNNRMELEALAAALRYAEGAQEEVLIYTDSAYISNCFKDKWYLKWQANGWKTANKEPVKNQDLWESILTMALHPNITIEKVKGHSSNPLNTLADKYAVEARKECAIL